ncbi:MULTISPECIES: JmjC domain-containing protein [unclassified Bradyrhizobium]|uniref:JmjC domain-containing protein n=1 Tax=unclassified Bradyrhizobium TaxID=2631580 RepID=UPI0028E60FC0|nr:MULTISPECIES: cupin domain-containing protein [unclassified Bradyrhizobium]
MGVLQRLIAPLSQAEFFSEYWPSKVWVTRGELDRFELPLSEINYQDIARLVREYSNLVMAVGKQQFTDAAGLTDRILVTPSKALSMLSDGAALELDHADLAFQSLRDLVDELKRELGLPLGCSSKAVIYVTPTSGGFPAHFDAYANFVLQLTGRKVWNLAPNQVVQHPTEHYDVRQFPYVSPELKLYSPARLPDEMPPQAEEVVLDPGSCLFVPRGTWHATRGDECSVSLNITLGQPTWLDLLLAAVRSRLVKLEEWRELADGLGSNDPARNANATSRLGQLLAALPDAIGPISPDDIVSVSANDLDPQQSVQLAVRQLLSLEDTASN